MFSIQVVEEVTEATHIRVQINIKKESARRISSLKRIHISDHRFGRLGHVRHA
jgi:hypothetical protein